MADVIIETDGGSRGNPGPAAYGSLVLNAHSGEVIADRGETIGIASNNVAEYRGLIGGLELALEHTPGATLEVRMDSKLVVEQMAGRWKIKHPDMKPLAMQAQALARQFPSVAWTWIPREKNTRADALANAALDARDSQPVSTSTERSDAPERPAALFDSPPTDDAATAPAQGWGASGGEATTIVMVRHGVTELTERKVFSGSGGENPGLNERGWEQARRAASFLARGDGIDVIVSSPLQRTQDTAQALAEEFGLSVVIDEGFRETNFGDWDGHSFGEIMQRWPNELDAWLASMAVAPPGGENFEVVRERVNEARLRVLAEHAGKRVAVISHVTPIKLLVREALSAPMSVLHTLEVAPASVTTTAWWQDGNRSLRNFSVEP